MIEKTIAAALEPIVEEVVKLERKLHDIELIEGPQGQQGPAGRDADPVDVEAIKRGVIDEIDVDCIVKQVVDAHNEQAFAEIDAIFN